MIAFPKTVTVTEETIDLATRAAGKLMAEDNKLVNEVSICIKNSETKMVEKHLIYDQVVFSKQDPRLLKMVKDATIKFNAATNSNNESYEIVVKNKLIWQ